VSVVCGVCVCVYTYQQEHYHEIHC
jgi:hypothetical protein